MDLCFWLLLNLCVPITGPICMLALFSLTHGYGVARQLIIESVRGGQLLWSAISLSAAAIYEAITMLEARGSTPALEVSIAIYCLIVWACSTLVMMATTADQEERLSPRSRRRGVRANNTLSRSRLVLVSICLVGLVVVVFTSTHLYFY